MSETAGTQNERNQFDKKSNGGSNEEEPLPPIAHLSSEPKYGNPAQSVTLNAEKRHDVDTGSRRKVLKQTLTFDAAKSSEFNCGDGLPLVRQLEPVAKHL